MIFCIDSGNSRIKWGAHDGSAWLTQGALAHADREQLADLISRFRPARIILANVAGDATGQAIRQVLATSDATFLEAHSSPAACGVSNGYANPLQLGVDRWCALIGARSLHQAACLVVMAGTATTIDSLDANGRFPGGLILPGIDLMRRALSRDTAALPLASGLHEAHPKNTDNAIISGCLEAQVGAIERAYSRIAHQPQACCLLSGGAAPLIAPLLAVPHRQVENLVLDGLRRLAAD